MEYAASVQAVAMRAVRLDATGEPVVGDATARNAFVTNQFTRVSWTPEYEAGEEIQQKNAAGVLCVYYKMPDTVKRVNLEVAICNPQPEFSEILAGGSLLTEATDVRGYALPVVGDEVDTNGVGLEVWTRRIVNSRPSATHPYWRWVFPFGQFRMTGDRVLENGLTANVFSGEGLGNVNFGDGPAGDWPFPASTASAMSYAADTAAPTGVNDYVAVIADV